jgi:hypothetical protein
MTTHPLQHRGAGGLWTRDLPKAFQWDEWLTELTSTPVVPARVRQLSPDDRLLLLRKQLATRFFVPSALHVDLALGLRQLLEEGLGARDPCDPQFFRLCEEEMAALVGDRLITKSDDTNALQGGCLLGCPGMGKSRTIEAILKSIPQTKQHHLPEEGLTIDQVRYLYVPAPREASIWDFTVSFERAMAKALGVPSSERERSSHTKGDALVQEIGRFVQTYGVGLLVLDEVQNLDARFWHGRQSLINTLVKLVDELGISLFIVGAGNVVDTLFAEGRFARRVMKRQYSWDPPECDDEWFTYVRALLSLQVTNRQAPFSDGLAAAFWDLTQGLFDISNGLFERLQEWTLAADKPSITEKIVRKEGPQFLRTVERRIEMVRLQRLGSPCQPGDMRLLNLA